MCTDSTENYSKLRSVCFFEPSLANCLLMCGVILSASRLDTFFILPEMGLDCINFAMPSSLIADSHSIVFILMSIINNLHKSFNLPTETRGHSSL